MADPVITVDGLGIEFYRGRRRHLSLREMLFRRTTTHDKSTFWALRDVSFAVGPGEAVGLVGSNGSGKSTLLKCLAGIYEPDRGDVAVFGRVSPFIELGVASTASFRRSTTLSSMQRCLVSPRPRLGSASRRSSSMPSSKSSPSSS